MTTPNPKRNKKMPPRRRGDRRDWVALAGRVPPETARDVLADCGRRGIRRGDWVAEAVIEKLARAA